MTDSQFDRLDKLIRVESMLDAFGGVPPGRITPHLRDIMERIAWMFDPYNSYRASGELYLGNANEHLRVIDENRRNVDRYVAGHENRRPLDTRYRDIGNVGHCFIVERIGAEALLGACSDNKQAVILWQERQDGSNQYTYFRRSALVGFALGGLYNVLNKIEGCPPSQGHGGSDNIGGSPLETGSDIDPGQMLRIIADNPHILAHTTSDIP